MCESSYGNDGECYGNDKLNMVHQIFLNGREISGKRHFINISHLVMLKKKKTVLRARNYEELLIVLRVKLFVSLLYSENFVLSL